MHGQEIDHSCDIAGVRNLQRVDARAREYVRFTQTMLCGTVPSISSLLGLERCLRGQLADLNDTQPHHVQLRRSLTSRLSGCEVMGLAVPDFEDLALDTCAGQLSAEQRQALREGTVNRIRARDGDGDSLAECGAHGIDLLPVGPLAL